MFKHFVNLQWKSFFRSASLGKDMAIKALMVFFAVYMLVFLAMAGVGLFFLLERAFPESDPLAKVSEYLVYWLLIELFFRYFMQKLPVMDVKPLLMLPVKKRVITHYILAKSGGSLYNFFSLVLFVPFVVMLALHGYPLPNLLSWLLAVVCLSLTVNYLNFLINKNDRALIGLILVIIALYALNYFGVLSVTELTGKGFYAFYHFPLSMLVPLALALGTYALNYRFLRRRIFLDASLKKKTKEAVTADLGWTKKFGSIAPFLQLDLKLIWRNKRTKTQVFLSLAMIFYGLVFYTMDEFSNTSAMMVFAGIFITGIFLVNFGQFIPAWDSAYYSMMMAQNIPLRKYLESKAGLISASVVVMFLLSIPYVYFGWQALAINLSSALYNLGINIPLILFFGSMNKKRIDLDKSAFSNMQGTGATQFLVLIPLLGVPMIIFPALKFLISFEVALGVLSALGLVGIAFRKPMLDRITEIYRKKKYGMIAGFKEKNS
ncbi:DUF5687 family protein [Flavobacteriaceae bacterium 3-367]